MVNETIVLFSGYARLPGGTVASELYGVMALVLLVDIQTGQILEADCTLSTRLAERFVSRLLVGYSLKDNPEKLIQQINLVYQGSAKKALITALRTILDKYPAYVHAKAHS
jgi:hypothetical protein